MNPPRAAVRFSLSLAGSAAVALLAASCGKTPQEAGAAASGPMPVMVLSPKVEKVAEWDEFSARIEAVDSVEIRPRITGYLRAVNFDAGQLVKKGDTLFEIEPNYEEAALAAASAALAQADAKLKSAASEAERASNLLKARAISSEEADTRMNGLASAKAAVQAAAAARDKAALDLEYTKVRSPIDGRVSRALVTRGNYVSGVAGFTTLLTTVVSVDPVHVYAAVDDARFLRYQKQIREKKMAAGADGKIAAELRVEGEEGYPHKGWIESWDNRIDPSTGSIALRSVFPNADGVLMPGSFARVRIPGGPEYEAVLVDEKYIATNQDVKYVMVVGAENKAEARPITLGRDYQGKRIVTKGLTAQDKVITSGLMMLMPGAPVQPLPPQAAPPAAPEKTTAAN